MFSESLNAWPSHSRSFKFRKAVAFNVDRQCVFRLRANLLQGHLFEVSTELDRRACFAAWIFIYSLWPLFGQSSSLENDRSVEANPAGTCTSVRNRCKFTSVLTSWSAFRFSFQGDFDVTIWISIADRFDGHFSSRSGCCSEVLYLVAIRFRLLEGKFTLTRPHHPTKLITGLSYTNLQRKQRNAGKYCTSPHDSSVVNLPLVCALRASNIYTKRKLGSYPCVVFWRNWWSVRFIIFWLVPHKLRRNV